MGKCNTCGKEIIDPHIECLDPQVTVTRSATEWIKISEDLLHYYRLLEAFDPGGNHRVDSIQAAQFSEKINSEIHEAVREKHAR